MRYGVRWAGLLFVAIGPTLHAVGGVVTDGAATLNYPATHFSAGDTDLAGVDPAGDVVAKSSWWYRLTSGDTREHPFPPPDTETYSSGLIQLHWNNFAGLGLVADETTHLFDNERPSGSFFTQVLLMNSGSSTVDLTVFHYLDPSAGGTPGNDSGSSITSNYLRFTDGASVLRYRAPYAQARQVSAPSTLFGLLNDAGVTNLDDSGLPFAPGDVAAAYQFRAVIAPGYGFGPTVAFSANLKGDQVKGERLWPGIGFPELQFHASGGNTRNWIMRRTAKVVTYGANVGGPNDAVVGIDDFRGIVYNTILTRNLVTGEVRFGQFDPLIGAPSPPLNWKVAATGDFDHDGKADILWRNATSQKLVVWLMNGNAKIGSIVPSPDQAANANWEVVGAADFNDDTHRDLLWYNATSGKLVIWYMNASVVRTLGTFTNPSGVGNNNWKALAVGDFGKGAGGVFGTQDIVWQNATSYKLVVWHMDFAGNRTSGLFTTPDTPGVGYPLVNPR